MLTFDQLLEMNQVSSDVPVQETDEIDMSDIFGDFESSDGYNRYV
jgi:hypothetical protein